MIFLGDTHGIRPIFKILDLNKYTGQNIIHVGDFGLGFNEIIHDVRNLLILDEMLLDTNNQLYVIRGNHDNPIFWDKSKGLNLPKLHNVHLQEDYSTARIEDRTLLFVGGAISIDRRIRMDEKPYPTWWEDEKFFYDIDKMDNIIKTTPLIDIVVTHTAPNFCHPQSFNGIVDHYHKIEVMHYNSDLKADLLEERDYVTDLHTKLRYNNYNPTHWIYGHFHSSYTHIVHGTMFKLLNINETYEVL